MEILYQYHYNNLLHSKGIDPNPLIIQLSNFLQFSLDSQQHVDGYYAIISVLSEKRMYKSEEMVKVVMGNILQFDPLDKKYSFMIHSVIYELMRYPSYVPVVFSFGEKLSGTFKKLHSLGCKEISHNLYGILFTYYSKYEQLKKKETILSLLDLVQNVLQSNDKCYNEVVLKFILRLLREKDNVSLVMKKFDIFLYFLLKCEKYEIRLVGKILMKLYEEVGAVVLKEVYLAIKKNNMDKLCLQYLSKTRKQKCTVMDIKTMLVNLTASSPEHLLVYFFDNL